MKRKRRTALLVLAALLLCGCTKYTDEPVSRTATLLDTVVTIRIYEKDSEALLDECIKKCEEYEKRFSRTLEGSEIYTLNHAGGQAVELSADTIQLIQTGLRYSELSEGRYDITVAPLLDVWDFKNNEGTVPDQEAIRDALDLVGYQNVVVDEDAGTVRLRVPGAGIDLGSLAKGYIADQLKRYLESEGVSHALIDLGGNILAVGDKPDGTSFNIGIQKPFAETGEPITSLKIKDTSVVTSGIYQRYFKVDDKVYHHILNPNTGYPYDNDLQSVSVVCGSSLQADVLSTMLFTLGEKEGMEYVNNISNTEGLDDVEAVFITKDDQLHFSSGYRK